jgi:diguanylate cyclase (GGDEF)-like protein
LNIAAKTTLTTLLVVAISLVGVGAIMIEGISRAANDAGISQARLLARTLAGSFAVPLARGEHELLQRQIDHIAELHELFPDIVRVTVIDQQRRIVAQSDPSRFGDIWDGEVPAGESVVHVDGEAPVAVVLVPVAGAMRFGTLELAVTIREPLAAARIARRQVLIALFATVLVLVAVLVLSLDRVVVRPLRRVAEAVVAHAPGATSLGIDHDGPPEVRALVDAFDGMAARLHENTQHLERMVDERTSALLEANERLGTVNQRLQELAVTDALTGLANRRAFTERLGGEIDRARRSGQPLSLLLIDIDHFKRLNDTLGHLEGDAALVIVAKILADGRRVEDLVSRFGGEEFAMVLPGAGAEDAHMVAERLRSAVEEGTAGAPAACTISIGHASLPDDAAEARALIAAADRALYDAKGAGRNRVRGASGPVVPSAQGLSNEVAS